MARGKGALLLLLLTSQGLRRARGSAEHERAKDSVVITLPRFFRGVRLLIPRVYVYACLGKTTTTTIRDVTKVKGSEISRNLCVRVTRFRVETFLSRSLTLSPFLFLPS